MEIDNVVSCFVKEDDNLTIMDDYLQEVMELRNIVNDPADEIDKMLEKNYEPKNEDYDHKSQESILLYDRIQTLKQNLLASLSYLMKLHKAELDNNSDSE